MEEVEVWKDVPLAGAPYEVSNLGRVRAKGPSERILKPKVHPVGGITVRMWYRTTPGGFRFITHRSVAQMVAKAFLPASDLPLLGYKDKNKLNCAASNLFYHDYERSGEPKPVTKPRHKMTPAELLVEQQALWDAMPHATQQQALRDGIEPYPGVVLKERPTTALPPAPPPPKPLTNDDLTVQALQEVITGRSDHMLQDMSRELSQALASKPDAMMHARDAVDAIVYDKYTNNAALDDEETAVVRWSELLRMKSAGTLSPSEEEELRTLNARLGEDDE